MAAAPRPSPPDFLALPPYALLVADTLHDRADAMESEAADNGRSRVDAWAVQMLRRAAAQTRGYATEDDTP